MSTRTIKEAQRFLADSTAEREKRDAETVRQALSILEQQLTVYGPQLNSSSRVVDYLRLRLARKEHETFAVLFLNAQSQLIAAVEMFRGTLTETSVYPREIAKSALLHNAAAVIFAHNHPSGTAEPSAQDVRITERLRQVLELIDVRVLDHIVVGHRDWMSLSERGLLATFGNPGDIPPPRPAARRRSSARRNAVAQ